MFAQSDVLICIRALSHPLSKYIPGLVEERRNTLISDGLMAKWTCIEEDRCRYDQKLIANILSDILHPRGLKGGCLRCIDRQPINILFSSSVFDETKNHHRNVMFSFWHFLCLSNASLYFFFFKLSSRSCATSDNGSIRASEKFLHIFVTWISNQNYSLYSKGLDKVNFD